MGLFKSVFNYLKKTPSLAVALGLIVAAVIIINLLDASQMSPVPMGVEGFTDDIVKKSEEEWADMTGQKDKDKNEGEGDGEDKEEPFADAGARKQRGKPKKMKGHRHNRNRKQNFRLGQKQEDADDDVHLDAGTTALMAFNKLSPEQVRMMRNDTQELVKTQKELMSTFKSMAPLLDEGKKLMDTFGGFMKE